MDSFIFHRNLKEKLGWLLANPAQIPSPLCFYGQPGNGKTTFAKHLASKVSVETVYCDANSHAGAKHSSGYILKDINKRCTTVSLMRHCDPETARLVWERCFIIDEWHNFTKQRQDSYKVQFEELVHLGGENNALFIICCNTDKRNGISKILSPAIHSRCHKISFDIGYSEVPEMVELIKDKYPMLDEAFITAHLPDMRAITREAAMRL